MLLGPVDDFTDMIPINHIFEIDLPKRRACDDKTVVIFMAHGFKVTVKSIHVVDGSMLGLFVVNAQ